MTDLTLFTFIGETVTNATTTFVEPAATALMFKVQMLALVGVTLYLTLTGYAIATGSVETPFMTFLKQCAKILFIGFFALNVDGYHNQVVTAFNGFESGLSDALNANAAGPAASIYETLDGVLEKGGLLAAEAMRQASDAGWNIGAALGWFMTGIFVSIGTLVFAVIGGANIIVAKFSLAIIR